MLVFLHQRLAFSAQYYWLAVGLWALYLAARRQPLSSSLWGALLIGEVLMIVQGVLGVVLFLMGLRPGSLIHILYGVVSVSTVPALYAHTGGDESPRATAYYALGALFLFGIVLRAIGTAG